VASFVTVMTLSRAFIAGFREDDAMFEKSGGQSWAWFVAGGVALLVLAGVLLRSSFGPPVPIGVPIAASLALLTASMAASFRSRPDVRSLWHLAIVCGLLVAVILVARLLVDTFDPVDPVERFLAQARDDYSEFDYPRRWVPAAAIAAIVMAGGLLATRRTGRIGLGILLAAASSAIGSLVYAAVATAGNAFVPALESPLMLVPILVMFSTFLGTIGALLGRVSGSIARTSGS
jgi:drug/metabolite transporter (DMT)-like permease